MENPANLLVLLESKQNCNIYQNFKLYSELLAKLKFLTFRYERTSEIALVSSVVPHGKLSGMNNGTIYVTNYTLSIRLIVTLPLVLALSSMLEIID
jgi:hypothetical protein